jgi:Gpi18-like mannosyltransferase
LRSAVRSGAVAPAATEGAGSATSLALGGLLLAAFVIRLLFIGADGFKSDVSTFEAWALALAANPLRDFFAKSSFADYPPGYFFVLWFVGHAYKALIHSDPDYAILKAFVKLPAILMDLVCSYLIFRIVKRFASLAWAFAALAFFAFNPASIFISAYWGQVDSVAMGFTLFAILRVLEAADSTGRQSAYALIEAWLAIAISILIKPPAVVIVPLLLAFVFATRDGAERKVRALATGAGIVGALALAYLAALAFHPGLNPAGQYEWLYGRYKYASSVYPFSSVNAFNLYAMLHHFWEPDSQTPLNWTIGSLTIAPPLYDWGILLMVALAALVLTGYLQRRDGDAGPAFLEGAMILSLGYFVFSTRMHERYIFNAFVLAMPLIWMRRRYLYAAVILTLTLLANLYYSLYYLHVVDAKTPGLDATDLIPWLSHPASVINVAVFLYLGWSYLGSGSGATAAADPLERVNLVALGRSGAFAARRWFAPLEGVAAMRPLDWGIAAACTVASFVLSFVGYAQPAEKYFDEIYYARAAEEYLGHKEIFEFTHPPLTKLIITFSTWLMHSDTGAGWRFMNLVVGALMVLVMYVFAKRLLGSTLFATFAAGLLVLDGMHFTQSRIATPEITVAFFSLLTLYAFYRFWLASRVRVAPAAASLRSMARHEGIWLAGATLVAAGLTALVASGQSFAAHVVAFLYFEVGFYLAVRLTVPLLRRAKPLVSYADGARLTAGVLQTPDGGLVPLERGAATPGEVSQAGKNGLTYVDGDLRIEYNRDGSVRYATPEGEAAFAAEGTMKAGGAVVDGQRDGRLWMWILAICCGCLAASKWNGLFDFFVIWFWVAVVVSQRYWAAALRAMGRAGAALRPAVWGNPSGFSFDIVMAAMLFVGATIYAFSYIPYFRLGHGLGDLVQLQHDMYAYHCCAPTVMLSAGAKHPYMSQWWQWPLVLRPISYFYHDWRTGAASASPTACCLAEILALPNPAIWWLGLIAVPVMGWLGWRERNKGYGLLFIAYFFQWLPWIGSPRLAFEYHFFPNLAVIVLADTILLQRLWQLGTRLPARFFWLRPVVVGYGALVFGLFVFFYPILAGVHITWQTWDARMWHWLMQNQWV